MITNDIIVLLDKFCEEKLSLLFLSLLCDCFWIIMAFITTFLGFNCGEAANFGTSKWLKVAKDAAVRRAVMNFLPMLSHQQLLYLLTMSFVSRSVYFLLFLYSLCNIKYCLSYFRALSLVEHFIVL